MVPRQRLEDSLCNVRRRAIINLVNWVDGVVSLANEDRSIVRTLNDLQVMVELGDGFKTGDAVRMAVRPDDVPISRDPVPDDQSAFTACVVSALFLGGSMRYQLDLAGLKLFAQAPRSPRFEAGERVHLRISADGCNVLAKD